MVIARLCQRGRLILGAGALLGVPVGYLPNSHKGLELISFHLFLEHGEDLKKLHVRAELLLGSIVVVAPSVRLDFLEVFTKLGLQNLTQESNSYLLLFLFDFSFGQLVGLCGDMSASEVLPEAGENAGTSIAEELVETCLTAKSMSGAGIMSHD